MPVVPRKDEILLAILDGFLSQHTAWLKYLDECEAAGEDIGPVPDTFWDSADALRDGWIGHVPDSCARLTPRVDAFREVLTAYDTSADAGMGEGIPGEGFWRAVEALRKAREAAPAQQALRDPEPLAELVKLSNMPAMQPAVMWNLRDDTGAYSFSQIKEEIDDPGRWTTRNPKWVHPSIQAEIDAAETLDKYERMATQRHDEPPTDDGRDAGPESIEDLIATGVPDPQIKVMRQCTDADLAAARKKLSDDEAERLADSVDRAEAKILELAAKGEANRDIAAKLNMDPRTVASVVRRATKKPAGKQKQPA